MQLDALIPEMNGKRSAIGGTGGSIRMRSAVELHYAGFMKPELVKEDGRVFEIDRETEQDYLNPKYNLSKEATVISPTGWLKIFSLMPISRSGP